MISKRAFLHAAAAFGMTLLGPGLTTPVWADSPYPSHPVRWIVPYAAGGATDVPARLIAPKLTEALGQPVVVGNRPGAGGVIGMEQVAKSPADGYTFVMASNGELVMNPSIYPKLPYDPFKELAPVSVVVESPLVLIVPPSRSHAYSVIASFVPGQYWSIHARTRGIKSGFS